MQADHSLTCYEFWFPASSDNLQVYKCHNSEAYFSAAIKIQIQWWISQVMGCLQQEKMHVYIIVSIEAVHIAWAYEKIFCFALQVCG
jgi:hypothetical protein